MADAQASGACGSNVVRVQVPFPALDIRKEVLENADYELIIPMNPRCESLNAGIAAAICMWQMKK